MSGCKNLLAYHLELSDRELVVFMIQHFSTIMLQQLPLK